MKNTLPHGYKLAEISDEVLDKFMDEWGAKIFLDNDTSMITSLVLSEEERSQVRHLHKNMSQLYCLRLGVFHDEELCGWFTGEQYNAETFYMRNSAILPNHRRKGLYTALMYEVLRRAKMAGFQIVLSRHTTTNNSIIIPKLKAGFVITSLEISDRFGAMVHLSYFFNKTRSKIMEFRAGDLKPDKQIKDALGIV